MATQNFGHLAMVHNRYQQYQRLVWIDSHLVAPYQVVLIVLHGFIARGSHSPNTRRTICNLDQEF